MKIFPSVLILLREPNLTISKVQFMPKQFMDLVTSQNLSKIVFESLLYVSNEPSLSAFSSKTFIFCCDSSIVKVARPLSTTWTLATFIENISATYSTGTA